MTTRVIQETLKKIGNKSLNLSFQAYKIYIAVAEGKEISRASIKELKTQIGLLLILKEELP